MAGSTIDHPTSSPAAPPEAALPEGWPTSGGWGKAIGLILVVLLAVGAMVGALVHAGAGKDEAHEPVTVTYVVPAGTAAKLDRGEKVEIMPKEVRMRVGDRLILRNDDTRLATVGPYTVRPGEKVVQTFGSPQTLIGECSLNPEGIIKIIVTA